jgi:hypothetical protein
MTCVAHQLYGVNCKSEQLFLYKKINVKSDNIVCYYTCEEALLLLLII